MIAKDHSATLFIADNGQSPYIPWDCPGKEHDTMSSEKNSTTYIVRIHFSKTSTETMSDKIRRMLKNEIRQM